jgi:hypothetical protein
MQKSPVKMRFTHSGKLHSRQPEAESESFRHPFRYRLSRTFSATSAEWRNQHAFLEKTNLQVDKEASRSEPCCGEPKVQKLHLQLHRLLNPGLACIFSRMRTSAEVAIVFGDQLGSRKPVAGFNHTSATSRASAANAATDFALFLNRMSRVSSVWPIPANC